MTIGFPMTQSFPNPKCLILPLPNAPNALRPLLPSIQHPVLSFDGKMLISCNLNSGKDVTFAINVQCSGQKHPIHGQKICYAVPK